MRPEANPLAAALAAMGLHAVVSLALGWAYPAPGMVVAGLLALPSSRIVRRRVSAAGGLLALLLLGPGAVSPLLAPCLAAILGWWTPARTPLQSLAVALPGLTAVVLAMVG